MTTCSHSVVSAEVFGATHEPPLITRSLLHVSDAGGTLRSATASEHRGPQLSAAA